MTKIDIFSGFLGAGKTTLIKKLIAEAYVGEKVVLIENEFGEIGIDSGFLKEAGIAVTEMNAGCICCSLVGDFGEALKQVLTEFSPDRVLIEPSGVGKLSDVIKAVQQIEVPGAKLNSYTAVVDAKKAKLYMKNFGEFFNDQVEHANTIVLSHTAGMTEEKLAACVALLREHNEHAVIVTTPWEQLTGQKICETMEKTNTLEERLKELSDVCPVCGHDHHDDHHEHHHHHHHDHCDHEHHHHDHGHHCDCGCGGDHHADEVFTSFGRETTRVYAEAELNAILAALEQETVYGLVLRAKGIVAGENGVWYHFDYVPGEADVRTGTADVTGRFCVIGSQLNESALETLFKER